jgi:hypothetical protein
MTGRVLAVAVVLTLACVACDDGRKSPDIPYGCPKGGCPSGMTLDPSP